MTNSNIRHPRASFGKPGNRMLAGKCLCGAIRYAVERAFLYAGYCHCAWCRAASDSAFSAFAGIEKDKLRVTGGEENITIFARNEDNRVSFCKLCGSAVFTLVRNGQCFHVTMGTLVDNPGIRPMFHIFVGSKVPWHEITDSLSQHAEFPPPEALAI